MPGTMDEQLLSELDTLWQMALFLEGGDEAGAEALLAGLLGDVVREMDGRQEPAMADDLFERALLRRFFEEAPPVSTIQGDGSMVARVVGDGLSLQSLLDEVDRLPKRARAALWLVLVRRRSSDAAGVILDIDESHLRELLRYRDTFMTRVLTRTAGRTRAERARPGGATS